VREVAVHAFAVEELLEDGEVARLQLGRQLQAEEGARRLPEARLVLGQRVEASQADRPEDAEEIEAGDVDEEGVAEPGPECGQIRGRVPYERDQVAEPRNAPAACAFGRRPLTSSPGRPSSVRPALNPGSIVVSLSIYTMGVLPC
jgi:hypothetical protein